MEFRFDAVLYCNYGDENFDANHIKYQRGPHVSRPCYE